jgi:hypothetical protein
MPIIQPEIRIEELLDVTHIYVSADTAKLPMAGGKATDDTGGDDTAQSIGARLSSHSQAGAYGCRSGGV